MASLDNSTGCDTGLVLGIGGFSSAAKNSTTTRDHDNYEPSLTLGLSDQQTCRQASPNSTISSVSVKRERDMNGSSHDHEDIDTDNTVRKKLRLTKQQSAFLEDSFKQHSTLNPQKQKQALARQLNLRPRQVEVWFQNRRARSKLKQTEVDCDFLKKCCEKLSDENKRLQKEVQVLKAAAALKPVPFYMQPALSMCPSCEKTTDLDKKQQTVPFVHHFFNPSSAAC